MTQLSNTAGSGPSTPETKPDAQRNPPAANDALGARLANVLREHFPAFDESDREWLIASGSHDAIPAGTAIVKEGIPLGTFYLVLDGFLNARASVWPKDRCTTIVAGATIGELTLLGSGVAAVSIEAAEASEVLAVHHKTLRKKLRKDQAFATRFFKLIQGQLAIRIQDPAEIVVRPPLEDRSARPALPVGPLQLFREDATVDFERIGSKLEGLEPVRDVVRSLEQGNDVSQTLIDRERWLGAATFSARSLITLCAVARAEGVVDLAERVVSHDPSHSALEKEQHLDEALVQKTVTMAVGGRFAMCTGVGDFRLSRSQVFQVAELVGVSRTAAKRCVINPDDFIPEIDCGVLRGMVSPFLPPHRMSRLSLVAVLCHPRADGADVAISLSPFESLLLPASSFSAIVRRYAESAYSYYLPFVDISAVAAKEEEDGT